MTCLSETYRARVRSFILKGIYNFVCSYVRPGDLNRECIQQTVSKVLVIPAPHITVLYLR